MTAPDTVELYTIIQRTGDTEGFAFLPPHGKKLDEDEILYIPGDLTTQCVLGGSTKGALQSFRALQACLLAGSLTILATPSVILYDATTETSSKLVLDGGDLGTDDLSWDTSG